MYVGPIIPQPEDYLVGGMWPEPNIDGIDAVSVPEVPQHGDGQQRFLVESTFYTRNCIACNAALGSDLGRWMTQVVWSANRMPTTFDQIDCPAVSTC